MTHMMHDVLLGMKEGSIMIMLALLAHLVVQGWETCWYRGTRYPLYSTHQHSSIKQMEKTSYDSRPLHITPSVILTWPWRIWFVDISNPTS